MLLAETLSQSLQEEVRDILQPYLREVRELFGPLLEAVVLYGSAARGEYLPGRSNVNLVLLLGEQNLAILQRYAKVHRRWARERIVVPLFLTEKDIRTSHDVFPLEYLEIKEHHVLLMGQDPFLHLQIDLRHLALQCEQEAHGNLMRLRQRFVEGCGETEAAVILMPLSLTALLPCLRGLFRLVGGGFQGTTEALLAELPARLEVNPVAFQEVWKLKRGIITPGPLEVPRLFESYLMALQALVDRIGHLRAEGRI